MDKPRIVVLDGYTPNPGDLSWDALRELGDCEIHDRTPPERVIERAAGKEIVLTNKSLLPREAIMALPAMKYIGVLATGYNVVDVAAARERSVPVTNAAGYSTASVAQMTMALMLELTQNVGRHSASARSGAWADCPDFCYWEKPMIELNVLTFGVIGYGKIAKAAIQLAQAFGMRIIVHTRTVPAAPPGDVRFVSLEDLLRESDVVSLHCPLTDQNLRFINAPGLALMKPTAFLINTSRGPLINEQALADALQSGTLAGAAVDVLSVEPPTPDNPLLSAPNCIVTPHIAWATRASRSRLMEIALDNLRAFLAGNPINVVN